MKKQLICLISLFLTVLSIWVISPTAMADNSALEEFVSQEEISSVYDGSWIQYAVYNRGYTYGVTRSVTPIFSDSGLKEASLIFTITEAKTPLLILEHYRHWNVRGVFVWFYTADGIVIQGYARESDLFNAYHSDVTASRWAARSKHSIWQTVNGQRVRVFEVNGYYPDNNHNKECE